RKGPDQLVERIMPPDVLARELDRTVRRAEGGRVHRPCRTGERLMLAKRCQSGSERFAANRDARRDRRQRAQNLPNIFNAAKAAAALAHSPSRPLKRSRATLARQPDTQRPPALDGMHVDAFHLIGAIDEPLAHGKAEPEI